MVTLNHKMAPCVTPLDFHPAFGIIGGDNTAESDPVEDHNNRIGSLIPCSDYHAVTPSSS